MCPLLLLYEAFCYPHQYALFSSLVLYYLPTNAHQCFIILTNVLLNQLENHFMLVLYDNKRCGRETNTALTTLVEERECLKEFAFQASNFWMYILKHCCEIVSVKW